MTGRRNKVNPEFLEASSVEDAIAKLQALKKSRGEAGTTTEAPKKRGRPPKVRAEDRSAEAALNEAVSQPVRRGRTPKSAGSVSPAQPRSAQSTPVQPSFGVDRLTAHRPLGLLQVQESADLDALLADPRLAGHIAMRLDEHFALVLPASLERLQAALLKVGHTPKLLGSGKRT